jgi:fatty acid CoA ligase FadD9
MLFAEFQRELNRRGTDAADKPTLEAEIVAELRQKLVGGRYVSAMTSSAPISAELKAWVESFLDLSLVESYGSTEDGAVLVDGRVHRPPVTDYKLADVGDLGYFHTDRPHPRGELLVKSEELFAGYYRRPEVTAVAFDEDGYYRTGDIMAEIGSGRLVYLDRRNDLVKLSPGEFVAVSRLESAFGDSPLVHQVYIYGNSARAYLVAVIVPTVEALASHHTEDLKRLIGESLQEVAKAAGLQSYELPRDFIIETAPFTTENGLLTGIGTMGRPKLRERYGDRLEQLYAGLAQGQSEEVDGLHRDGANQPAPNAMGRVAKTARDKDIPHVTRDVVVKYTANLQQRGLL